jgi:hypothetical protein
MEPDHTNYCPHCGQENHNLNIPLRHFVEEVAEGLLHFDTKSIRTIRALLFSPGFLTAEFIRGRRARYVTPIRLYIFISFVFFLVISFSSGKKGEATSETASQTANASSFNITFYGLKSSELRGMSEKQIDAVMQAHGIEDTWLNKYIVRQEARIGSGGGGEFSHLIVKGISYMMFVLMPFLGFLVYLFFRKREPHYIGMLVYSLHYHSYAFFLFTALLLLSQLPMMSVAILISPLVLGLYLFLSLKTVYQQRWWPTLLKTILIGSGHIASAAILFLMTAFVSVLLF